MHIISALLLGLAANLDNFGVGVSSGIVTFISVLAGHLLSQYIMVANMLGALMIVAIGFWVAVHKSTSDYNLPAAVPAMKTYSVAVKPLSCIIQITKNPSFADLDANGFIASKEAMALGLTLSFNCIATGWL